MEHGYVSTRETEKLCKTDIRFMYLLNEQSAPSHMTIDNFMNCCLAGSIENIFKEINKYIFEQGQVDTEHIYIYGTKIEANANKYSWVWKKSSIKNREYKRARRRGLKGVNFELALISCGFNLHKYHLKKQAQQLAA